MFLNFSEAPHQHSLISVAGSVVKINIILTVYISSVNISEEKQI